jgi:hypothetical protein
VGLVLLLVAAMVQQVQLIQLLDLPFIMQVVVAVIQEALQGALEAEAAQLLAVEQILVVEQEAVVVELLVVLASLFCLFLQQTIAVL